MLNTRRVNGWLLAFRCSAGVVYTLFRMKDARSRTKNCHVAAILSFFLLLDERLSDTCTICAKMPISYDLPLLYSFILRQHHLNIDRVFESEDGR